MCRATKATDAQVLVSKYADHLPLYRQAQIYAPQGVNLDRSTLAEAAPPSCCDRFTSGCSPS
jgi:transposase